MPDECFFLRRGFAAVAVLGGSAPGAVKATLRASVGVSPIFRASPIGFACADRVIPLPYFRPVTAPPPFSLDAHWRWPSQGERWLTLLFNRERSRVSRFGRDTLLRGSDK